MIRVLLILSLCGTTALADGVTTDAFGILPTEAMGDRVDWAGVQETTGGEVTTQEAAPVDAVILFVGPKSIVAGQEPGHAVALALDHHGNMVDAAAAQMTLGFGAAAQAVTDRGIADHLFTPPPVAGDFLAGAEVDGAQSARAHYRVTAYLASVEPGFAPLDDALNPETFGQISTAPLLDQYGNAVDDGVGMTVLLTDQDGGISLLPFVVRDSTGQGTVLSRDITGEVAGTLALAGTDADGLSFEVGQMDLRPGMDMALWAEDGIEAVGLLIGPIQTDSGFLVPDGTLAEIRVEDQTGAEFAARGWILDGSVSFTLPIAPASTPVILTLRLAGNVEARRIEIGPRPDSLTIRGAE